MTSTVPMIRTTGYLRNAALRRLGLLTAGAVMCLLLAYQPASAQLIGFADLPSKAVGVGIWYAQEQITFDAAEDSASTEVKGYTDVLPTTTSGTGPGIAFSFSSWGLIFGLIQGEENIGKAADVNGTPLDSTDDVFIERVRRSNRTLSLVFQPVRWFYMGYGRITGVMEFDQITTAGTKETRKLGFEFDFYSFGVGLGFDPTKSAVGPFISLFAKFPVSPGDFTGSITGAGLGLFF